MRALSRECVEEVASGMKSLLRRTMTKQDCAREIEQFSLAVAQIFLESDVLPRRLNGLKYLQDCIYLTRMAKVGSLFPSCQ